MLRGALLCCLTSAAHLAFGEPKPDAPPGPVTTERFPARVHVFEDFETEIEKRWWLRGSPEEVDLPGSVSSQPNTRAFRAGPTKDFDRKMGDQTKGYNAVIFNPVPGPPMGSNTRLLFRYKLKRTDSIRVQIFSLSNGYHRRLTLTDLPRGEWRWHTVDMTGLRRPDGSGGALSEDERIDDIQFYIDPAGELLIDDIVLFEAAPIAPGGGKRTFPRRIIFTGWFDTGKQGAEWPGDFAIVPHEKPLTWDAAKAVPKPGGKGKWLRIHLRGERGLGTETSLRFRHHLTAPGDIEVKLAHRDGGKVEIVARASITSEGAREWAVAELAFPVGETGRPVTEIQIHAPGEADLLVDDVLLFEP